MALAYAAGAGRLEAFTVDHSLRSGSADEARQVGHFCRQMGIFYQKLLREGPVPDQGLPAFARSERHRLLLEAARERGLSIMALGHTRDDQDETLRMRGIRCSDSLAARAGMAHATLCEGQLWLCRPFLAVTRTEIRAYLSRRGSSWIDDPSNVDLRFERVRIRALPDTAGQAGRLAKAAAARMELIALGSEAAGLLEHACGSAFTGYALAHPGLRSKAGLVAVQALISLVGGARRAPDEATMARIHAFLQDSKSGQMTAGRALLTKKGDRLQIVRERRGLPAPIVLAPDAQTLWDDRFSIRNLSRQTCLEIIAHPDNAIRPLMLRNGRPFEWHDGVSGGFAIEALAGRAGRLSPDHAWPVTRLLFRLAGRSCLKTSPDW